MADTELIDYAENLIRIKQHTRGIEEAVLKHHFERAGELATLIAVESRLLSQNMKLLNDNNGIPYQVELQRA
jgi:hypothetical protein